MVHALGAVPVTNPCVAVADKRNRVPGRRALRVELVGIERAGTAGARHVAPARWRAPVIHVRRGSEEALLAELALVGARG